MYFRGLRLVGVIGLGSNSCNLGELALPCSATSQDSNAEFRRDVATPLKMRPTSSTLKLLKCFVTQPLVYITTYANAAFFLPLHQTTLGLIKFKNLLHSFL